MAAIRSAVGGLVVVAGFLFAGCGDDATGPEEPTGFTEPDQVVRALAESWELKLYTRLDEVLSPDFRFYVRDDEITDFPWMTSPSWSRADELSCAWNMFDAGFAGEDPPVQAIEFEYTVLSETELQPGTHQITIDAVITVLTGPADGWSSDTRFVLDVTEQPDGFLLLSRMSEVLKLDPARGTPAAVETTSWAQIKALYRGIPVELTDPFAVVQSLAQAWGERNADALGALLAPDFGFFVRDDQAADFPWMTGPSWDRETELAFAANMFDSAFSGSVPPVWMIDFDYTILSSREVGGEHEVTVDATVFVLTSPSSGWSTDTRFVLRIAEQPDGFLRVREMREILRLGPARAAEEASWGSIKNLYRQ